MARISVSMRDQGEEIGNFQLYVPEPTLIDGVGSIGDHWAALEPAIAAVTLGVVARSEFCYGEENTPGVPGTLLAQREWGLRIFLQGDEDARVFTLTLPTVDAGALTQAQGDNILLADGGVMAALVTALEARLLYPSTGASATQNVTVTEARLIGRNS